MPTFPIPVFSSFVLVFAAGYLWYTRRRFNTLVLLLILCATQSLIIALAQHYDLPGMRHLQPLTASLIPPIAWIAYQTTAARPAQYLLHILVPLAAVAAILIAPQFLDVLLPGIFVVYGGLILYRTKEGADTQPNSLLSSGEIPSQIWILIGAFLIASAISDVLIVISQIAGYDSFRPWIISVFSVGNLLAIGFLCLSPHLYAEKEDEPTKDPTAPELNEQVWVTMQAYMVEHKPYLDPDLTLTRLSRKLGIPVKTLSSTINRATGNNVSRFVNNARIKVAQEHMLNGETVTNTIFLSGFNTKSNFNREFKRVVGCSPIAWLRYKKRDLL